MRDREREGERERERQRTRDREKETDALTTGPRRRHYVARLVGVGAHDEQSVRDASQGLRVVGLLLVPRGIPSGQRLRHLAQRVEEGGRHVPHALPPRCRVIVGRILSCSP